MAEAPRNPWTVRATRRVYENPWIAVDEHDGGQRHVAAFVRAEQFELHSLAFGHFFLLAA